MKYLKNFESFDWDDEDEEDDTHHSQINQFFVNLRSNNPFDIIIGNYDHSRKSTYYITNNIEFKAERNNTSTLYIKVVSKNVFSLEEQYFENYDNFLNEVEDFQSILAVRFRYTKDKSTIESINFLHSNNMIEDDRITFTGDNFIFKIKEEYHRFVKIVSDNLDDSIFIDLTMEHPYILSEDVIKSLIGKVLYYSHKLSNGKYELSRKCDIVDVLNRNPASLNLILKKNSKKDITQEQRFTPNEIIKLLNNGMVREEFDDSGFYSIKAKSKKWWQLGL